MSNKIFKVFRKFYNNLIPCIITLFIFALALINCVMSFMETDYFSYPEATYAALESEANSIIANTDVSKTENTDSCNFTLNLSSEDGKCKVTAKVKNWDETDEEIDFSRNIPSKAHRILLSELSFSGIALSFTILFCFIAIVVFIISYYCCKGIEYTISKVKKYFT